MEEKPKTTRAKNNPQPATPGPKPEVLKIQGNWKGAIKHSLTKQKPPEGWPK